MTDRLVVRPPTEDDRLAFVALFCDPDFMVFSSAALLPADAHRRFDHMLEFAAERSFAKQPIVDRESGEIAGYVGVDTFRFRDGDHLEMGWRLAPHFRGRGYATEAATALLFEASTTYHGEILAIIHVDNLPSQRVAAKTGFSFWQRTELEGEERNLYRIALPVA